MRIVYMGTPDFAVPALESLVKNNYEVALVISQQDKQKGRGKKVLYTPVKQKAIELGLNVHQPKNVNDDQTYEMIKACKPDFIVVAAYGQILKNRLLELPNYYCLNIHASLLPKYRGAAPINWAIINGDSITGITIMKMEEGLDSGPMVLMDSVKIEEKDTFGSLHNKLQAMGSKLIIEAIEDIAKEAATFEEQDDSKSSYAPMIYKDTGKIDWNKTCKEISGLVRGLNPHPSAYLTYKGDKVKVHQVRISLEDHKLKPGTIATVGKEGLSIATSDGFIIVEELQFPNKKSMSVASYLLGNHIETGYIL
ncbi:MAG: methionyl-tRNA formyltransferase [Gudongella sp.]|nr:methionyl-tRNA formyltransferase [Gudongella sp.]